MSNECTQAVKPEELWQTYSSDKLDRVEIGKTGQYVTLFFKDGTLLHFETELVLSSYSLKAHMKSQTGLWSTDIGGAE